METLFKFFATFILINSVCTEEPVVETTLGTIRGVRSADGNTNEFMGIPYASVNESNPFGVSFISKMKSSKHQKMKRKINNNTIIKYYFMIGNTS